MAKPLSAQSLVNQVKDQPTARALLMLCQEVADLKARVFPAASPQKVVQAQVAMGADSATVQALGARVAHLEKLLLNIVNGNADLTTTEWLRSGLKTTARARSVWAQVATYAAGPPEAYTVDVYENGPDKDPSNPSTARPTLEFLEDYPSPALPIGTWVLSCRFRDTYYVLGGYTTVSGTPSATVPETFANLFPFTRVGDASEAVGVAWRKFTLKVENGRVITFPVQIQNNDTGVVIPDGYVLQYNSVDKFFFGALPAYPVVPGARYSVALVTVAGLPYYQLVNDADPTAMQLYCAAGTGGARGWFPLSSVCQDSIEMDGTTKKLHLVGDFATLANFQHYCTDGTGARKWDAAYRVRVNNTDTTPRFLADKIYGDDKWTKESVAGTSDGSVVIGHIGPPAAETGYDAGAFLAFTTDQLAALIAATGLTPTSFGYDPHGHLNRAGDAGIGIIPPPEISPSTGVYSDPQSVTITDTDVLATIYYRTSTDGGTTWSGWTTYSAPFSQTIPAGVDGVKVQAEARRPGWTTSEYGEADYTLPATDHSVTLTGVGVLTASGAAFDNNADFTIAGYIADLGTARSYFPLFSNDNGTWGEGMWCRCASDTGNIYIGWGTHTIDSYNIYDINSNFIWLRLSGSTISAPGINNIGIGYPPSPGVPTATRFTMGYSGTSFSITARMDGWGVWSRALTDPELADLAANYYTYATLPSGLHTGLTHWWDFDETTGDRVDVVGGLNLTPGGSSVGYGAAIT